MMKKLLALLVVALVTFAAMADEKKSDAKKGPEPVRLTDAQVTRLTDMQRAVTQAGVALQLAQKEYEKQNAAQQAMLRDVALELHLNLDTHELKIVDLDGGGFGFAVKAPPKDEKK